MLRYVFLGTPDFASTVLNDLCAHYGPPSLVVTQPAREKGRGRKVEPTDVALAAQAKGIAYLETANANEPEVVDKIRAEKPDLLLVVAFGQLLKEELLTLPTRYCLNVHASLLPHYRGAAPIQRAIWNGDQITGVSVQKMVKKLDAGDVLIAREIPIDPADTSETLFKKLADLGGSTLREGLALIEAGKETFTPQDETKVTYAKKLTKEEAVIDWNQTATVIEHRVRALIPWPTAETAVGRQRLKVLQVRAAKRKTPGKPGDLQTDHKTFISISCGDQTTLDLLRIQPENRKPMAVSEYLSAFRGHYPFHRLEKL